MVEIPEIEFKEGQTYSAAIPFYGYNFPTYSGKIHIIKIIDEGYGQMIVFRCYGKHKRWWHYFIESKNLLEMYIHKAKRIKDENIRQIPS